MRGAIRLATAQMLARVLYGLPAVQPHTTGCDRGGQKGLLTRLQTAGLIDGDQITATGKTRLRRIVDELRAERAAAGRVGFVGEVSHG